MPKSFKCPICGCTEHYQIGTIDSKTEQFLGTGYSDNPHRKIVTEPRALIKYDFSTSGDTSAGLSIDSSFEAYLCKKCGHVELFAERMLRGIHLSEENLEKQIKEKETSAKESTLQLKLYETEKKKSEERLEELGELLKSEDITLKQQRQFNEEKEELESKLKKIDRDYLALKQKVGPALDELQELKERLKCVGTIASVEIKKGW